MTTATHTSRTSCPSVHQLTDVIRGIAKQPASEEVAEHIGACVDCQCKMEELALAGAPGLSSDVVRHLDKVEPPSNSAYWRALRQAELAVTQTHSGDTPPSAPSDLRLDFLAPSSTPGRLGMIGTFEIIKVIGRGGMGVVLHAFDPCLQRDVAVKILDPQLANNNTARERFCREARSAAAVTHESIVAVYQVDEDTTSGLPFLVMQLVNGESLEQRLRRVGRLSVLETVKLGVQAASGLASAHAGGLIHRDVKPGNILIESGTDKVRLTDFGLARAAEDMKLTKSGFVAGTPLYMAPEQARGEDIDARADLFSLGSVLYEALAGQPPFEGKTPLAVLRRVADESHEELRKVNTQVPMWLEDIIDHLLAKDPADRFQSAEEVAAELSVHLAVMQNAHAKDSPVEACGILKSRSSSRIWRRRDICKTKVAAAASLFLGMGLGGLAVWGIGALTSSPSLPSQPAASASVNDGPDSVAVLPVKSGAVWSLALNQDATLLAVGSENGRVSLWDAKSYKLLIDLHPEKSDSAMAHKGPVWAVDFTQDRKRLVSASDDGTIKVWELPSGKQLKSLPIGTPIRAAAVSPDGNSVVVGDRFGSVRVFDLSKDAMLLEYQQDSTVNGVAFSPDGKTVASVSTDGNVVLWDILPPEAGGPDGEKKPPQGRKRFTLSGHGGPVYGLAFSTDGTRLATASWDQNVIVWDLDTRSELVKFQAHEEGVWAVQVSPCCGFLATAGQDGKTRFWNATTGSLVGEIGRHRGTVHAMRFSGDGSMLATGGRDGTVRLWDVKQLKKAKAAKETK